MYMEQGLHFNKKQHGKKTNMFPEGKLQSEVTDYSKGNAIGTFTSFKQRWAAREPGMFTSAYLCHQMEENHPAGQT